MAEWDGCHREKPDVGRCSDSIDSLKSVFVPSTELPSAASYMRAHYCVASRHLVEYMAHRSRVEISHLMFFFFFHFILLYCDIDRSSKH